MKTFKQYMKEAPHPADGDNPVDGDMMLGDLTSDAVVERLNAYVGAIADREYLNPEKAVAEMRQKLMRVGIHFGDVQFTGESGDMSVPITKPIFGKDLDTPADEIVNEEETGRSINFVYEKLPTGTHKVMAQIS